MRNFFVSTPAIKAFGADAVIQRVSWGVVAHGVPIRRMKLSSEMIVRVVVELQRANGHAWGRYLACELVETSSVEAKGRVYRD